MDYYDIYKTLPRPSLLTIYKSVIGPHLDYGDIIYDQACLFKKVESIQYNAALAITGAICGISKEKTFWRARLGFSSTQAVVQKTMLLLYNFERPISKKTF